MSDFTNFRGVYDELTDEVMRSHMQFLSDHLRNWFEVLDTTEMVAPIIQRLQSGLDYKKWRDEQIANAKLGGVLAWPQDRQQQLGMRLLLFRSAVEEGRGDFIAWFGHAFLPSADQNVNNSAKRVLDQIFRPMAQQLRRLFEAELNKRQEVPASDRIVTLNHNSPDYQHLMSALETLEEVLRGANDYPDAEEKERVVAEVSAGRRLLQAARARAGAIATVLAVPAAYLAKQFMGKAVGDAAQVVIDFVTRIFGHLL
jgi:hypothetical protein